MTAHLLALVGSLRRQSVNAAVARAALDLIGDQATMTVRDIGSIPLYNGDDEEAGPPAPVVELTEAVAAADGLVLFSPEYNSSFPAVTKNVIDWLSRPPRLWEGTAVTMVTATPGPRGGLGVRAHFDGVLAHQPVRPFEPHGFGNYRDKLSPDGELTDPETRAELAAFLDRFVQFCLPDPDA